MRIAHVANFYGPRSGGLRTTMHRLGRGYLEAGHEVLHIVPGRDYEREWTESGLRITIPGRVLAGSGGYRVIVNVGRVRRMLAEFRPDALEVSDRFTLTSLGDWARENSVRSVVFSHETLTGLSETFLRAPFMTATPVDWWNARLARRFDHVVATTKFAAREFERLGVKNLVCVPLGVDLREFHPSRYDESLRTSLLGDADTLLVHCGRLSPEKRVDRSVQTAIELARRGRRVRLVVAGDGPSRASLERLAAGHPVTFVGFVHDREALARILAAGDVVLAPGPLETFCLAALEALASGTPVVASESSAVREVLGVDDSSEPVGAVARDDEASFADAVEQVLGVPTPKRRLAARERAEQFPWSKTVEQMLSLLRPTPSRPSRQAA
jgi:alpha-1,6-mannosyltransferase